MTDWLKHPVVRDNGDGTYTLADEDGRITPDCWRIKPVGAGWRAVVPGDGFGDSLFATAGDAIGAVLGDPAESRVVGGKLWTMADCGWAP